MASKEEMLGNWLHYQHAKAETKAAYERYNYAASALDMARVRERAAEVASQAEPLNSLIASDMDEREKFVALARYISTGRKDALAKEQTEEGG